MPLQEPVFVSEWGFTDIRILSEMDSSSTEKVARLEPQQASGDPKAVRCNLSVHQPPPDGQTGFDRLCLRAYEELTPPLTRVILGVQPPVPRGVLQCDWRTIEIFSGRILRERRQGRQTIAVPDEHVVVSAISEHGRPPIVKVGWFTGNSELPEALAAKQAGWSVVPYNFATVQGQVALLVYRTQPDSRLQQQNDVRV